MEDSELLCKVVTLIDGDTKAAMRWMSTPRIVLGNQTPIEHSRTGAGTREVEDLIGRIEHGHFL